MSLIFLAISGCVVYKIVSLWLSFRNSLAGAKRSGLPYIVSPVNPSSNAWRAVRPLLIPWIKRLPAWCWEDWIELASRESGVQLRHDWFAKAGSTVLIVMPTKLGLFTSNAEAIRHFTLKREQFPKQTQLYGILKQFGENVVTTEGAEWRMHRKVTAASFNEKNSGLVFVEAIQQAQSMLGLWNASEGPVMTLRQDCMRLALNVISYVGFGMRLLWPGQTLPAGTASEQAKYGSLEAPEGHKLSFADTIDALMHNILILLVVPKWILGRLPFERPRKALVAHHEYIKYMDELLDSRIEDIQAGTLAEEGMDLMGQLAKASFGSGRSKGTVLSREEILGNAFIMLIAGHESTANTLHFVLLLLALNPSAQRHLQRDLDRLVGDTDPSEWSYDKLVNPMMASMLGACMHETLRLLPAVTGIPKMVTPDSDQAITVDGVEYVLPSSTKISIITTATHTNPRYWPGDDLLKFVPERWFRTGAKKDAPDSMTGADAEDFGGFQGGDTSDQLFRPERGSYLPFSDGARSCLGRRIAQVELIAALAVIFQKHSVELAVDEWAGAEEVGGMSRGERAMVYEKAQAKAQATVDRSTMRIALKLDGNDMVPVRLAKRGEEQFVDWLGEEE